MSAKISRAFIAMGANLGNPLQQIDIASLAIGCRDRVKRVAMSPVYQSLPHGVIDQPDFINSVLEIQTTLSPQELLEKLHAIELKHGRERKIRWGARTLDLDIILYGDLVLETPTLTLPHPRAYQREFVVKPLFDLDNRLNIPPHGRVAELVKNLPLENLTEIRHGITYHH